jgi:mannose-6-phosphate isomerase-like protein (cupin superfamily)
MILKCSEQRVGQMDALRGGEGTVIFQHFLEEENACGAGRMFAQLTLPKGASIGYHKHEGEAETFYVLEGKAKLNDNGKEVFLEAGDASVCFDGDSHSVANVGEEDLKMIAIILFSGGKA